MVETIRNADDIKSLKDNRIIIKDNVEDIEIVDSEIVFEGINNILYIEPGVKIHDSNIKFLGSNNIVYLSSSRYVYYLKLDMYNNSTCYIGRNCSFNREMNMICSEQKNIIIGNDGLFSFDIWVRNADPHLIYDMHNKKRINNSRSVYIGDHVWIGQHAMLLKGCKVGSGSIIGAMAVTGSSIESNCVISGNPGKIARKGIFWINQSVHRWDLKKTKKYNKINEDDAKDFLFRKNSGYDHIEYIESNLRKLIEPDDRLEFIIDKISGNDDRERFSICSKKTLRYYRRVETKNRVRSGIKRILKTLKIKK